MINGPYKVIRSNGASHGGFPIPHHKPVPAGYQLMGFASNYGELQKIMFP